MTQPARGERDAVTITEFLLARLAEDEGYAPKYHEAMCKWSTHRNSCATEGDCDCGLAARRKFHLAEVEAKRRIVGRCAFTEKHPDWSTIGDVAELWELADQTLADLASVYSDHHDYDPAWSVTR